MAQDDILIRYKVDTTDLDKASVAVADVTAETKQLQTQIKATFSDKSIEQATKDLYEQGDVMGALITKYGSATTALKAMEKELATMSALGQRNTAQFKELANATAELKDNIGDTRSEIKKMASDTRVFDTMVQGARGITAAFSVATGVTAVFGKESEDLQKAILKVQGAMAALQGVQELANIATEKGGIATKAYGAALQVVDKISKVTGLSMAASWALATGGITLAIAGIASLIMYLKDAKDSTESLTEISADNAKQEKEKQEALMSAISEAEKKKFEDQEYYRKKRKAAGEDERLIEIKQLDENIAYYKDFLTRSTILGKEYFDDYKNLTDEQYNELRLTADKYTIDAELRRQQLLKDIVKKGVTDRVKIERGESLDSYKLKDKKVDFEVGELSIKPDTVDISKVPNAEIPVTIQPLSAELAAQQFLSDFSEHLNQIAPTVNAIGSLVTSLYAAETQALDEEKAKQLAIVGDDLKKKEKIEKEFAIKQAQIAQKQAIANKVFAIFDIAVNTAQSIAASAKQGFPQAIPFIVLAAAQGALQAAAVAAQPLPQIPQFEKGGAVPLAGGRIDNGYLIGKSHREGGVLINAQGGEYIWDRETTARHGEIIKAAHEKRLDDLILHKYVAPALKAEAQRKQNETYDDYMLRHTIKQGHLKEKKNAEYIVNGVTKGVSEAITNSNRYR